MLQHDTFNGFKTRVVAPLVPKSGRKAIDVINPVLRHARKDWVLATHLMSVIPLSSMTERVGSLAQDEYKIKRAIDQLFLGI